jgi:16S rRNA (cytosine1402-N4)-methyltransferase
MNKLDREHIPVMGKELLHLFESRKIKTFFEGTVGAGGHATLLLQMHPEITTYLACDRDREALGIAEQVLRPWKKKVELIHGNFADLHAILTERKIDEVDGFFLILESPRCS